MVCPLVLKSYEKWSSDLGPGERVERQEQQTGNGQYLPQVNIGLIVTEYDIA
jgi:hypothetical protein